jgi:hypothetical protein
MTVYKMDKPLLRGLDAPSTQPTPSSTVPLRRDRDFVHREILTEIQSKCSQPASRVALVGLGGVGYVSTVILDNES